MSYGRVACADLERAISFAPAQILRAGCRGLV